MNGPGLIQTLGALAVTLGVLGIVVALLRRLPSARDRGAGLEVLHRLPLGPRQGIALVRVAGRVLVVGLSEQGVRLLTELPADECATFRAPAAERGTERTSRFALHLPGLGRIALLVLGLAIGTASAHAQPASPAPAGAAAAPALARPATPRVAASAAPRAHATPMTPVPGFSVKGPAAPQIDLRIGDGGESLRLSGAVGLVVFLGALTLLPALFLLMTSFTRILIVLHFLRSALGTQTAPPSQLLVAFAVLLTGVVMNPVLQETQRTALQPYLEGRLSQVEAYRAGVEPFREFMLAQTRAQDLQLFAELSRAETDSLEALPTVTVVSAFVTSELRTAFQMGFLIFLPFVVVDVIVASVLMSLGMFMLPPIMISLPFKLLLFVLADGWTLVVQSLVASFR